MPGERQAAVAKWATVMAFVLPGATSARRGPKTGPLADLRRLLMRPGWSPARAIYATSGSLNLAIPVVVVPGWVARTCRTAIRVNVARPGATGCDGAGLDSRHKA